MRVYQLPGWETRDAGFGGRGGAVLEIPLADLDIGVLLATLGVGLSLVFASNIEAIAATDTGLCTSSSVVV